MKSLLKVPTWLLLIIIIVGVGLSHLNIANTPITSSLLKVAGIFLYNFYPVALATVLNDYLPIKVELYYNLFLINAFIVFICFSLVAIIADGEEVALNGLEAIPAFYFIYSLLHFCIFPVKTLKSIELNREAHWKDYFGDFLLMIFLPIGILIFQPRVKRIMENAELNPQQ